MFGHSGSLVRVARTSNGYRFNDPKGAADRGFPSKSDFLSGTGIQDFSSSVAPLPHLPLTQNPPRPAPPPLTQNPLACPTSP